LYLVWGSTYFVLHLALQGFPPFLLGALRFLCAGAILYAVLRGRGERGPTGPEWRSALLVGAILFGGANGGLAYAQQTVSSSVAALVSATMPLWMAVFAWWSGQPPTLREWLGLSAGFAGVALIHAGGGFSFEGLAALALLGSPMSWAIGSLLSRRLPAAPGAMANAAHMIGGGLCLCLFALLHGEGIPNPSPEAWAAWAYLVFVGSLVGFVAYGFLLRNTRPAFATSYAYVNPVVAVLLGVTIGHEALSLNTVLGAAVILAAVAVITLRTPKRAIRKPVIAGE
jgi:drug/metabolite transporter (DMT)-like permease